MFSAVVEKNVRLTDRFFDNRYKGEVKSAIRVGSATVPTEILYFIPVWSGPEARPTDFMD